MRVRYLFIMRIILKVPGKPFLSLQSLYAAAAALAATAGVLGNGCPKPCINTFPYYRSTFKRRALLS